MTLWEKLREPFPPEQIGTIPKAGVNLSYVGHAAVTDRLLQVDPTWTWEPFGVDEHGRPILAENQGGMQGEPFGLWIKLTVNGVTRPGFGGGKNAKECISDAIRNAAMRFGVALDLWAKEDLGGALPRDEPKFKAPAPTNEKKASAAQQAQLAELIVATGISDQQVLSATEGKATSELTITEAKDLIARLATYAKNLKAKAA